MLKSQTVVRNVFSNEIGVIVPKQSHMSKSVNVYAVIYDGSQFPLEVWEGCLEIIGQENAASDYESCGVGQGEDCCIFVVVGSNGLECQRFGEFRWSILGRKQGMMAKREPTELYPKCKLLKNN